MMNIENEISKEKISSFLETHKKIFFMRVCGTGMGACAALMKEAGYEVEGADTSFAPPMSDFLNDMGITCHDMGKVNKEFLRDYDLIVVGNSVARGSELARLIEDSGVLFTSFPTLLGESILKHREVLAVVGTHGKTTTSYFLTQMLENLNLSPGYFIGGVIEGKTSSALGKDSFFVIEGDEYDSAYFQKYSKFHQYFINDLICTSIEFDHADIFSDFEAIKDEFRPLFSKVSGHITYDEEYEVTTELLREASCENTSFYNPRIMKESCEETVFEISLDNKNYTFKTNVIGQHNIRNIAGCIKLLWTKGFRVEELKKSILKLNMVKRRQEHRGCYKGAIFIDDFAHHPKAIEETIKSIKLKYPRKKVIVVFEPVSATARSNVFQKRFAESFSGADKVIIADTQIQTTAKNYDQLDTEKLVETLGEQDIKAQRVLSLDKLLEHFEVMANEQSLFLILSNRTCLGLWSSQFVKKLI